MPIFYHHLLPKPNILSTSLVFFFLFFFPSVCVLVLCVCTCLYFYICWCIRTYVSECVRVCICVRSYTCLSTCLYISMHKKYKIKIVPSYKRYVYCRCNLPESLVVNIKIRNQTDKKDNLTKLQINPKFRATAKYKYFEYFFKNLIALNCAW